MEPQQTELRASTEDSERECMRSSGKRGSERDTDTGCMRSTGKVRNGDKRGSEKDSEKDCMRSTGKGYVRAQRFPKRWLSIMYVLILLSTAQGTVK